MSTLSDQFFSNLVRGDRVHRRIYTDPEIFEAEMAGIFEGGWVYAAHTSELPEPGDFRTMRIGRTPVVLTRTADGGVSGFINRCPHRGATVCQERSGNAKLFRCEYHGWTFRNTGALAGVPNREGYPERVLAEPDLRLKRIARVEAFAGLLFVSLSADVPPLAAHLGNAAPYIEEFTRQCGGRPLRAVGATRARVAANWKLQMENGVDGYHAAFTHRSFMDMIGRETGEIQNYATGGVPFVQRDLGNGHVVLDQRASMGSHYLHRLSLAPHGKELVPALRQQVGEAEADSLMAHAAGCGFNLFVFPNLQLIGIQIRKIVPERVSQTEIEVTATSAEGLPDAATELRLRTHELFNGPGGFGSPDDWEIFERVAAGLAANQTEWLLIARGLDREQRMDGVLQAQGTDELTHRGQYREWVRRLDRQSAPAGAAR